MTQVKAAGEGQAPVKHAKQERPQKRNTTELVLWLLVIVGLLVLVLQGTGYVKLFTFREEFAAIVLSVIGIGLASAAVYSYVQGLKLKETVLRLTEQQRRKKRSVTIPGSSGDEHAEEEVSQDDHLRNEQLKFAAVIEERQRLARELHDAVSQQLFAISMTATAVSRTLDKDFDRAKRQVALIEEMASVAQSEMRALLLHLRPVHLEGKNLAQALDGLLTELRAKVPMAITFEMEPTMVVKPDAEEHLFRIVQEALSNTLRHAKASRMDIGLHRFGNQLRLILRDDGVGFDMSSKKQTSYGLLTMRERVLELGGTMQIHSAPGEGTLIEIWVPVITDERGTE
jgi:two-component system, NarL family, sensor histidine kinase LiaS